MKRFIKIKNKKLNCDSNLEIVEACQWKGGTCDDWRRFVRQQNLPFSWSKIPDSFCQEDSWLFSYKKQWNVLDNKTFLSRYKYYGSHLENIKACAEKLNQAEQEELDQLKKQGAEEFEKSLWVAVDNIEDSRMGDLSREFLGLIIDKSLLTETKAKDDEDFNIFK